MGSDLIKCPLEECLDALIDYRGKTPKKVSSGVPLITAKVVKSGRIEPPTEFIAEGDYAAWMTRGYPEVGDIVLTTEAPLGEVAQIKYLPVALAQRIVTLRGKEGILDNNYLLYLLQSSQMQEKLIGRSTGTTVVGIKQSELRKVEVTLPPMDEQRAIAHILSTIDDKIELNRQTNKTLEEMAHSLFKAWFVDFEPVRAKMNGSWIRGQSLPGLPAHFYDLFPNNLVKSEWGDIPEGWNYSTIGEQVTVCGGSTPSTKKAEFWENGNHCWATPKDLSPLKFPILLNTNRKITDSGLAKISSGLLPIGTVLLSSRAPIGYLAIAEVPTAINQGFIAMKCDGYLPNVFVLLWCRENMDAIISNANGSTFQEISKSNFRPIPVIVPPQPILDNFKSLSNSFYQLLVENEKESHYLSQLRDTLLPKLISGELRIENAKHIGGAAL